MGVALLSTENTVFQLILYIKNTQPITSVRIYTTTTFTVNFEEFTFFFVNSFEKILGTIRKLFIIPR